MRIGSMKLIRKFRNTQDAAEYCKHLRKRGVLTHVSSVNSLQLSPFTGVNEVGVWVILPEQYDILNPEVILTEEQMQELEAQGNNAAFNIWNKFLLIGGLICFAFFVYVFFSIE